MCGKLICLASFVLVLGAMGVSPADAADPNQVGWWKFDGDGLDASGNSRNGTLAGDAHFVTGYSGQALALDGDGDYFTVDGWKGLLSVYPVTVSAWVKTTASGDATMVYWGRNSGTRRVDFRLGSGRLRVEHGSGNIQGDTTLNDDEWHHVALAMQAGAEISYPYVKLYLDGQDDTRNTSDPDKFNLVDNANNVDFTIGRRVPQNDRLFPGLIDEVQVYNKELVGIQIKDLATLGYLGHAHSPDPGDGQKYEDTWATLNWTAGPLATSHDVYFSTSFEDVNTSAPTAFVGNTTTTSQPVGFPGFPEPNGLVPGTTYYWRVDEISDTHPDSPWRGDVWSFWIPSLTAYDPIPGDGEPVEPTTVTLSWSRGLKGIMDAVYFGTDKDQVANAAGAPPTMGTTYDPGPLANATTYYWRVDTFNGASWLKGAVWTFTTRPDIPVSADPNLVAWWKLDESAGTNALDWSGHDNHGKLFGTDWTSPKWLDDADGALTFADGGYVAIDNINYSGGGRTEVTVSAWVRTDDPNDQYILSFDRNEYYRLQINGEVATDGQVGWHVMTVDAAGTEIQVDYGSVTRVDDGLWHHITGVFDHGTSTIFIDGLPEPSKTGAPTYGIGDLVRYGFMGANSEATAFNGARGVGTGVTGDLGDLRIYDKALTQEEILQAMRGDPRMAWDLRPTNGRILEVGDVTSTSWRPGDGASQHDVYFGKDADAVANADASDATGIYRGRQNGTSYTPPEGFEWAQTYYWRIDEVAGDGTIAKGRVHAIKIADYLVVDDFEAYDAGDNQIWYAWHDGLGYGTPATPPYFAGNGTGAAVGDETTASYTEETIVQSGRHSMPVTYDNNKQGFAKYSEVEMTLTAPRDWTKNGVKELSLWYVGDPCNISEPLYVAVANTGGTPAVVYNVDPNLVTSTWTEWVIPLQAFAEQGIDLKNVNTVAVGIGTRGNMTIPGGTGKMYFDDIRLYRSRPVTIVNPSFELPGTEKQKGFDNVPGWSTDGPCADSGVETGYTPTDGDWTAYLMSGDPSVWQLTDHLITKWDALELKVDARITWAATTLKMGLYYDDNGIRVPAVSQEITLSDTMQEYTLSFSPGDVPASVGHKIGVEFSNASTGDTWVGLDNVRLAPPAQ